MQLLPHAICLAADPWLLWLHVVADGIIAAAYFSIPVALMVLAVRRRDLFFRWAIIMFAGFVVACGTTHVLAVVTIWEPVYWLQGGIKLVAALMSAATAALIWPLLPKLLALPSPDDLTREVAERQQAEAAVRRVNQQLEARVHERTAELERINLSLAAEIDRRGRSERALIGANQAKSRFLAAASHDLRQPFQALRLFLDMLSSRIGDGANRPLVDNALQALEAGEGLLHSLLDISTLQAGTVQARPTHFPLADLLDQIATEWRPQAAIKGVELRVVPSSLEVVSDPILLLRVLRNLTANAVRYTESGRILVGCRRLNDGGVRLEVWDTGPGIPKEAFGEIFEEFTQLGNPERDRTKGLGLGLAIVHRLAQLLGLEVTIKSTLGRGSLFRVHLLQRAVA